MKPPIPDIEKRRLKALRWLNLASLAIVLIGGLLGLTVLGDTLSLGTKLALLLIVLAYVILRSWRELRPGGGLGRSGMSAEDSSENGRSERGESSANQTNGSKKS